MIDSSIRRQSSGIVTILSLLTITLGCTKDPGGPKTVPASGVVSLDGTPVEGASIVFIGDNGKYSAQAQSSDDGSFSLNAFEFKTGAVPGSYKAIVTKTEEITTGSGELKGEEAEHAGEEAQLGIRNAMPEKYSQPTGLLAFVIPEEGTSSLVIELTSN